MKRARDVESAIPRLLMGLGGLALIGVGLIEFLGFDLVDLLWVGFWLAAGVLVHDGVLSPALALVAKFADGHLPVKGRRTLLVALVAIGSLTLIALPFLGRRAPWRATPRCWDGTTSLAGPWPACSS